MPRPKTPTELHGNEQFSGAFKPRSQTYSLTHITPTDVTRTDWERESFMDRSFISFSFGGRWIEDWSLIATFPDGRLQRAGSAEFEDLTTTYDVVDGQFYWGTHFTTNQLELSLATDGMTQQQLDDFKHWFSAGNMRELVLAEHPNRAIMARVATPPIIYLLPFEEKTTTMIAGEEYETSTSLYKGEMSVTFVMDEPFWYSKTNILGRVPQTLAEKQQYGTTWAEIWTNSNNEDASPLEDKDAIKVILEDGIPVSGMFQVDSFLGSDVFAQTSFTRVGSDEAEGTGHGSGGSGTNEEYAETNAENQNEDETYGFVGPLMRSGKTVDLPNDKVLHLYYPGTAPTYPTIKFTIQPIINERTHYINSPANDFEVNNDNEHYDTLFIESDKIQKFCYTLPGAWNGYNQAIKIFKSYSNISNVDLRKLIRDGVNHKAAREWAIAVVDSFGAASTYTTSYQATACNKMKYFLCDEDGETLLTSDFTFDCKTGKATGVMQYRLRGTSISTSTNFESWGTITEVEESVGDMVISEYLKIEDRNYPNEEGYILPWSEENPNYSHRVYTNTINGLSNIFITYKYMYY